MVRGVLPEERACGFHPFAEQPAVSGEHIWLQHELDIRHPRSFHVEIAAFIGVHANRFSEAQDPDDFLLIRSVHEGPPRDRAGQ